MKRAILVAVVMAAAGCGGDSTSATGCHTSSAGAAEYAACVGRCIGSGAGLTGDLCGEAGTRRPVCICRDASAPRTCESPAASCATD